MKLAYEYVVIRGLKFSFVVFFVVVCLILFLLFCFVFIFCLCVVVVVFVVVVGFLCFLGGLFFVCLFLCFFVIF